MQTESASEHRTRRKAVEQFIHQQLVNLPFRLKNIDSCEQPFTKSENTLYSQFPICLIMISHLINPSQITFFSLTKISAF